MQYYKDYYENSNADYGKLIYLNEKYYVNNVEIINNRGIINDIVYIENNSIIGIKERCIENITGILYLDSKIKYGNIKNKQLLLFKPTDKTYPHFYIPYKNTDNINRYAIINFKEWKNTDKLPIGILIEIIGKIGDRISEFEYLRNYFKIKNNIWKIENSIKINDIKKIDNLILINPDYEVFSIDPTGSTDIDDAFHYKKLDEFKYEIGIHIASPVIFFENNIEDILNRVSSIYLPNRKYNMLPNEYADNICSLLENTNRYALSLILTINNKELIDYRILNTVIKNCKNYNYDQFDKIVNNSYIKEFVDTSNFFFGLIHKDSHKLVENWMIYANKIVAKYLIEKNFTNIILRKHDQNEDYINNNQNNIDKNLLDYLNIRNEKCALYELYDINSKFQTHSKLDNSYYTHFTSPIRRAVDLFIHLLIIKDKDIFEQNKLINIVDNINKFTKNSRKFSRMVKRLDFLYKIKEEEIISYGYIINIGNYSITLFIPEYNLEEKIIVIPRKFDNIINIKDKLEKYKLYEKIKIKLWVFTSFDNIFDKLKIEIIEN